MPRTNPRLAARIAAQENRPTRRTWTVIDSDGREVHLPVRALLDGPREACERSQLAEEQPDVPLPEPSSLLRMLADATPCEGAPVIEGAAIQFAHRAVHGSNGGGPQ